MEIFDLAIAGSGFLPAVLALQLRDAQATRRIVLLSGDREIPGRGLELVFPERLPRAAAEILGPCTVREWPALMVAGEGGTDRIEEQVALIDPLQLWAELLDRIEPGRLVAGCETIVRQEELLRWNGGQALATDFIDLRPITMPASEPDIVAGASLTALELPVVADRGAASEGEQRSWRLHVPIGQGHVAVRGLCSRTAGWIPRELTRLSGPDYYQFLEAIGSDLA